MPPTSTGVLELAEPPLPSCPELFAPQQRTDPPASTAQASLPPTDSATASWMPVTATAVVASANVPLPSWPSPFSPQQRTPPLESSAQLCRNPAPTAIAVLPVRPETLTGTAEAWPAPLPSWPSAPRPQHLT